MTEREEAELAESFAWNMANAEKSDLHDEVADLKSQVERLTQELVDVKATNRELRQINVEPGISLGLANQWKTDLTNLKAANERAEKAEAEAEVARQNALYILKLKEFSENVAEQEITKLTGERDALLGALRTIAFFTPTVGQEYNDVFTLKDIAADARAPYLDATITKEKP